MANLSDLEKYVAIDIPGVPSLLLTYQTRQACIDFCHRTFILNKDHIYTITTSDIDTTDNNKIEIDLSLYQEHDERPFIVIELDINDKSYKPEQREFTVNYNSLNKLIGTTIKYFKFISDYELRIYGAVTGLYRIRLASKPMQTANTIDDLLYNNYLETIVSGAKYRLLSMPGKEWTDADAAIVNYKLYKMGIADAKAEYLKGFTMQALTVKPINFVGYDY